jgi:hypothetical protein
LTAALIAAVGSASAVLPAVASPVPGASYDGMAADGASVHFTVSPDGTIVDSYEITGVHGNTCVFTAEGIQGGWPGAPIGGNQFHYQLGPNIDFHGVFNGRQSASGTFRLYDEATSQKPVCDTGSVSWTATTTTAPPASGVLGSSGSGVGAGPSGSGKTTFATRVALRRASQRMLGGSVTSTRASCRAGRTIVLWQGRKRVSSTKTSAKGIFSFSRSTKTRGRAVRASVLAKSQPTAVCGAGSSKYIAG